MEGGKAMEERSGRRYKEGDRMVEEGDFCRASRGRKFL